MQHERTLICGDNGAGKTTLLDALTFVLFGRAFRNINKPLLCNTVNDQDCVVELIFLIGKISYLIRRGIKPNIFEIYINGKMVDQNAGIYDYQDYLEKNILKFNLKTFKQIMVLGSKSFIPFMQLTAADRRVVIEELLDIQIFSAMAKVTRNKLDHLRDTIKELEKDISVTNEKITLQKQNILNNTTLNQSKIATNNQTIQTDKETITTLTNRNVLLMDTIKNIQPKEIDAVSTNLTKMQKIHAQLSQNLTKNKKDHNFFNNNDNCPTCKQQIDLLFKQAELDRIDIKQLELHDGLTKLEALMNHAHNTITKTNQILQQILQHQTEIDLNRVKVQQLEEWNKKLEVENIQLQQMTYDAETNDLQLQKFFASLNDLNMTLSHHKDAKKYLELAGMMLKDGGIKASIVKQYLPIMNNYINKYLSFLDFFANFTLNENFEESILARHRDKFAYESFSDGEKLRIDLALLFAWCSVAKTKNSVDTNLLILDEIIDSSLDNQGIDDFFKLLSAVKDTNIFVISPKGDILVDKFDHVIRFEKRQNFSEIV